jgi:signal transduction histidine kinase
MSGRGRWSRLGVGQLFGLSMATLAFVGVVGLIGAMVTLDSLGEDRRAIIDRIDPALVSAQELLTAFADQQTGVLGFALAGDPAFLEPYERGRTAAPRALDELRSAYGERAETAAVIAAARAWTDGYAAPTVAAVRSGRTNFTAAEVEDGRKRFARLRATIDDLGSALRAERALARDSLRSSADRIRGVVIAYALAVLLSALAAALVLRRTVVAPIGRLATEVRAVVTGSFGRRVEGTGAREIVHLGEDVDAMRGRIVAEVSALESARDELQRSNAELEQFAYVASHDLQEPLRKVASFTQMLQNRYGGRLDDRADSYIDFAVDGAKRMQELINDLLAFSRVGRVTDEMTVVDCNELVEHAQRSMAGAIEDTGARVEIGALPSVRGEARLLELVFANLLSNGIKFRGDDAPLITLEAKRDGDEWCFTVADNGIGIDPEYADRIFIIFQRLHPRSAYDGTGIGLAMCRKIVEYHGGRIWFEASTGPGATFRFTLPAIEETA